MTMNNVNQRDLYAKERDTVIKLWAEIMKMFAGKDATDLKVMSELKKVATDRFANAGFAVSVDPAGTLQMGDDGKIYSMPEIEVIGVYEDALTEFDHDQFAHEMRAGLIDGVPGTIREDGTLNQG